MEFKKNYYLLIRNAFIKKQLIGIGLVLICYGLFIYSSYYQKHILPASNSWIAFLANLGFILLANTYFAATIGHVHLLTEKQALPFWISHPKNTAKLLSSKFSFQLLISFSFSTLCYWLFIWRVGSLRFYDQPFFRTIYFTLLAAGLVIQALNYSCSMKSLPEANRYMPDKHALKGFVLSLFFALLTLQVFQYQIQNYLDYLVQEEAQYPLKQIYWSLGGFITISVFIAALYLENGYRSLQKRINALFYT